MDGDRVSGGHCGPNRGSDLIEVAVLRGGDLGDKDRPFSGFGTVDAEGRNASRPHRGMRGLHGQLDVLWVVIPPVDDQQIFAATHNEQLTMGKESEISGTEVTATSVCQQPTEYLGGLCTSFR